MRVRENDGRKNDDREKDVVPVIFHKFVWSTIQGEIDRQSSWSSQKLLAISKLGVTVIQAMAQETLCF